MWSGGRGKEGECHSDSCRAAVERLCEWTVDTVVGLSSLLGSVVMAGDHSHTKQGLEHTHLCTQLFFHPDCAVVMLCFTRTEDRKQHVRIKEAEGRRVM